MSTFEQQITVSAFALFSIFHGNKMKETTRGVAILAHCRMHTRLRDSKLRRGR